MGGKCIKNCHCEQREAIRSFLIEEAAAKRCLIAQCHFIFYLKGDS
ncbi:MULTISPECIES: hypothetical protein [Pelosinus]|nr:MULTISPECIES: hypothetical protein [Pelosinus]